MHDRGSSTLEFALVMPMVLFVLVGAIEVFGIASARLSVMAAAREGARAAAIMPAPERAVDAVRDSLPAEMASHARISVRRSHLVGGKATVEVRLRMRLRSPLLDRLEVPIAATATMLVER